MSLDPTTIGRFKVLGELGRGAMGVVYLAEDPVLKRGVAIKVVRGDAATQEDALARFQKEAEISAKLAHPGVVMVFDVGEAPGVGPFMAMELVEGEPLSEELARGPMKPQRAALLLVQGVHALEAAHAAGITHRDIKPENFMVSRAGSLKLMDFGIARRGQGALTTSSLMCTPSFAAPELLEHRPPGEASDRWAFAATAFNCITGDLPFRSGSLSGLLYQIAHEPPILPPDLEPGLAGVFTKAFQKRPEDRHPDLRTFYRELLEALPLEPEARAQCLTLLEMPATSSLGATVALAFAQRNLRQARRYGKPLLIGGLTLALLLMIWAGFAGVFTSRKLSVTTTPSGARVFLDGKELGTSPIPEAKIPRKAQRVRLEKEGFLPLEQILSREDRVLDLRLQPEPLVLAIATEPAGAEVFLDGALKGLTPLSGLQAEGGRSHALLVRKAGYEPWTMEVDRGQLPPAAITLKRATKNAPKPKEAGFWDSVKDRAKKIISGKS
jgi:serine/threonine-protein kinase